MAMAKPAPPGRWDQMLSHAFRRVRFGPESIREVVFGVEDGVVSMSMGTYLSSQAERDALVAAGAPVANGLRSPIRDAMVMAGAYAVGPWCRSPPS